MKQHFTKKTIKNSTLSLILFFFLLFAGFTLKAATYTVTSTANGTTTDGVSLRWAITQANGATGNTIAFNIAGAAPHTITLTAALPAISNDNITIDGSTQPLNGGSGDPKIILDGGGSIATGITMINTKDGMVIYGILLKAFTDYGVNLSGSINCIIGGVAVGKRVVINNCGNAATDKALYIQSGTIKNTYIGTDSTGAVAAANTGYGIYASGSDALVIGGSTSNEGCVISNNSNTAIYFSGSCDGSSVKGCKIGTNKAGTAAFGNGGTGIYMAAATNSMTIGGSLAGEGNIISGNGGDGIYDTDGDGPVIRGNYIGTDITGTLDFGNTGNGIYISGNANNSIVGGNAAGDGNLISGNGANGILITGGPDGQTGYFKGNKIGTDITGTLNIGNGGYGIYLAASTTDHNNIGGTAAGDGNIIAYNVNAGIGVDGAGAYANWISRNSIFCNASSGSQLGIDLFNNGNDNMPAPVITSANATTVSGTSDPNAIIEVFIDDNCVGCQGKTYVGTATANGAGSWTLAGIFSGNVTATATKSALRPSTSEFSSCMSATLACDPAANGCAHVFYTVPVSAGQTISAGGYYEACWGGIPGTGSGSCNSTVTAGAQGNPALTPSHLVLKVNGVTLPNVETPYPPVAGQTVTFTGDTHATCPGRLVGEKPKGVGNCTTVTFEYYLWVGPPTLSVSSQSNVNCSGSATGSATVTGCGGTPGYTYSWAPGGQTTTSVTGLSAGTYTVTATSLGGCTSTLAVTITSPGSGVGSSITSQSNVNCNGSATGSATVTGTAGTPGYTYSWSPGGQTTATRTGLTAGTYSVTVTDNGGCSTKQVVTITQPISPITSGISAQNNVGCTGSSTGSATVTVSGGTPTFSYLWNNGQTGAAGTGLTAGTYSVTITDGNSCTAQQTVSITQPASAITSGVSPQSNVGCTGAATGSATVTASGGTPTFTYLWNNGQTNAAGTGLTAGTYSVTITDGNSCTKQQTVIITQPVSAITSGLGPQSNVGCTGSSTGSATVTVSGGTPTFTYLWNNGQTDAAGTGLTAGTYIVTVTDANGCTATQSVAITQPASALSSSIVGQVDVKCTGNATGTATVTGSGGTPAYTYLWNNGVTSTTEVASGLTAGSYIVTITDVNGCSVTQSVAITQPAAALTAGATSIDATCGGSNGTATVTTTGGTSSYTYSWNTTPVQTSALATGLSAGSYNVIVTDANNCTANASVSVNNASGPTVGISGTVTNVSCTGNATGTATVTATGGTGTLTYSWNNGVTSTTGSAGGLTAGTYIVTVTDGNGCVQGQTVTITQPAAALSGTVSQSNVGCTGLATGSAIVTAAGGTPGYTYAWSNGVTTGNSVTGLTAGTYSVIITDGNGCTNQQTVTIAEPAAALGTITSSVNAACNGNNGSASVTASGGTIGYVYSWSPNGATDAMAPNLSAGIYTVLVTDANGCTSTATASVGNNAGPVAGIGSTVNVGCLGAATGSTTITASGGTAPLTYSWNNGVTSTTNIASGLTAGTYIVTVKDANNCSQQQSVTITQPATSLSVTTDSINAACGSSNGTAIVIASGGTSGYTYNWGSGVTTSNSLTGLSAGTYSVTVIDANGCTKDAIAVVNGKAGPSITGTPTTDITCNGLKNGTATLTVANGILPYTYAWNPNVTASNTFNGLSAGTYTVIVSDSAFCKDTVSFTINEPLPITFTLSVSNATVCSGDALTLLTTTPSGGTAPFTFTWYPSGPVVSPLVPTTYSVTATDASGCISLVDTIRVVPIPSPIANFDTTSSGTFGMTFTFIDLSTSGTSWFWDFGDGKTSTLQNPSHTFSGAGKYTVTQIVKGLSNCADTITKVIIIYSNAFIPNVFTPNNDGVNDEFWIPNTGFESFNLAIFDRWGLKLFETDGDEIRWDGRTRAGEAVPDGTYYYLLVAKLKTAPGEKEDNYNQKGFINLVRGGN